MTHALTVFIPGTPAPQGSKRHVGGGVMIESSKAVKPWRQDVRAALLDSSGQPVARFEGAVSVRADFVMPRPASTPKRSTPPAIKRPDLDKLIRAVLDAVGSAGVWRDDSQVVEVQATKRLAALGESAGLHLTVEALA